MAIYNIHAGHGKPNGQGCGAVGILDESAEARKVKDELIKLLSAAGNTVYDCTYEGNANQSTILSEIVKKCNAHNVDLDISIHLNSGRNDYSGDGSTGGVEVYGYNTDVQDIGGKICTNISNALGIRNRGFKTTKSLYVLNNTKAKAILIECCFVDDKDDTEKWNAEKCAKAVCEALGYQTDISTFSTTDHISAKRSYIIGDYVQFGSSYPSYNSPFGVSHATKGSGQGKITSIKDGQACYEIDNGKCYCNDGDIKGKIKPEYINYRSHVQGIGWDIVRTNGQTSGTIGKNKRLEAVKIDCPTREIEAKAHIQSVGDVNYGVINSDTVIGTTGQAKRLEAIWLKGNIKTRVHIQNKGWTEWTDMRKGTWLGTKGQALRLEAVEIMLL